MKKFIGKISFFLSLLLGLAVLSIVPPMAGDAQAVPTLQLYSEEAFYQPSTESWMTYENPFTLQVLGADQPDAVDYIGDVMLHLAVPEMYWTGTGSIGISGEGINTTIAGSDFAWGIPPELNGSKHGVYEAYYSSVLLPDLMVSDAGETIYDYVAGALGEDVGQDTGDIQNYLVSYSDFFLISLDLTGTVHYTDGTSSLERAPFSHNADAAHAPEPGTFLLLGAGLAGLASYRAVRSRLHRG
jgi:hypothetical protein